jgi:hypothetical protein
MGSSWWLMPEITACEQLVTLSWQSFVRDSSLTLSPGEGGLLAQMAGECFWPGTIGLVEGPIVSWEEALSR